VTDAPLIPAPLYGLRNWRPAVDDDGEALAAASNDTRWPDGGAWLHATCRGPGGHDPPDPGCTRGVHAWHPRLAAARRVLGSRFAIPGVVEAAGAIELQDDGFRAQRARPYAIAVTPGGNRARARRLADRYDAQVAEVDGPAGLVAWCRERGLGLDEATLARLLGPDYAGARARNRSRHRRRAAAGVAAVAAIGGALLGTGAVIGDGSSGSHGIYGRTGWVRCPDPPPSAARHGATTPVPPDC
jgi:hypothetical protein